MNNSRMAAGLHVTGKAANSSTSLPKEGTRVRLHRILTNSASAVIFGAFALAATVPAHAGTQGINWTDWIRIDRDTYDACIDPSDYRPRPAAPAVNP